VYIETTIPVNSIWLKFGKCTVCATAPQPPTRNDGPNPRGNPAVGKHRCPLPSGCVQGFWGRPASSGQFTFSGDLSGSPQSILPAGQDSAISNAAHSAISSHERAAGRESGPCGDWPTQTAHRRLGQRGRDCANLERCA